MNPRTNELLAFIDDSTLCGMCKVIPNTIDDTRIGPPSMNIDPVARVVRFSGLNAEGAERRWREVEVGLLWMEANRLWEAEIVRMV